MPLMILRYWKLALCGLLLIALAVQTWRLGNAKERIEDQRNELATCRAERAVQDAAIEAMGHEAERQRVAYSEALRRGNETIREAQRQAGRVQRTPPNGCATPSSVMEAPL